MQREDRRVSGVQPGVLEGLPGVVGSLGDVAEQGRGEVPGRLVARGLQRREHCLRRVEPPVPQGQRGVEGRLLDEGQQGGDDELTHVGGRGPEGRRGGEVAGAGHGEQRRGDGLGDVACRLPGGDVEGQLVHDRLECIRGRHRCEGGVVGAGDSAVHGCRGRMVGQLKVHRSRGALAVDFDLEGVQGRLVGFRSQALSQAGVDGHEAGGVGQDGALDDCEIAGQSVGGEVRGCRQSGHLTLQCCDGCGVDSNGSGVCGVLRLWGICGEDRSQLSCGDALELHHRRLCDAVVEDPPREG